MKNSKDKIYGLVAGLAIGAAGVGYAISEIKQRDKINENLSAQVESLQGQVEELQEEAEDLGKSLIESAIIGAGKPGCNTIYLDSLLWVKNNSKSFGYDWRDDRFVAEFDREIIFPGKGLVLPRYNGKNIALKFKFPEYNALIDTSDYEPGSTLRFHNVDFINTIKP